MRHDGILENRFVWDQPYEIESEHLLEIADAMTELSGERPRAILSVAGLYGSMTPAARKVDIHRANDYTLAIALVIQELSQRLLANFYFKIKSNTYPVKIFKSEEEATAWLQQQIRTSQKVG